MYNLFLVFIANGKYDTTLSRMRQRASSGDLALVISRGRIASEAHHLPRRLHFRGKRDICARELHEREYCLLYCGVRQDDFAGKSEFGELAPGHAERGKPGEVHADRLADERDGTGGARIDLDHVDLARLDRELDVHEPVHMQRAGEFVRVLADAVDDTE